MFKKIALTVAAIIATTSFVVSAEKNPYNEMDCINLSNATIQDCAASLGVSIDEFKSLYGLPADMPGDTNEAVAVGYTPVKIFAKNNGVSIEEAIAVFKMGYEGSDEITGDTLVKDVLGNVKLSSAYGEDGAKQFIEEHGLGEDVTGDTLVRDVENIIKRKTLSESGKLSYDDGDEILVMVKGKYIDFDVAPVIQDNRVLVPMRNIFTALGATVSWQGDVQTVLAMRGDTVLALQPNQKNMFKNSEKIELDVPALAKDGRILVPIRAVAQALDTDVYYNANTKTVVIH